MRIIKFPEQISEDIIHYTFLDDIISYNCEKCRGSCCHVNNSLLLDAKTASFLKRTYLKDFIVSDDSVSLLSCGKKCWFHSELGCTINDLGLNKPLTCELYPFHIKKIQNFYIVSFTPCPTFQLNLGEGQRYKDIEDVVLRYIKTGVPVFSPSLHVSEERLKYEIEYQNNFKNTLSEYYRTKTADGTTEFKEYEKWYIYYLDLDGEVYPYLIQVHKQINFGIFTREFVKMFIKKYHIYEQITYTLLLQIDTVNNYV